QCSSGCESGWTLYLEQSFLSNRNGSGFVRKSSNFGYNKVKDKDGIEQVNEEEEEEEDLSMVSDASSGPSHYFQHHHQDQQEDLPGQTNNQTGSMESVLDYSQGFSATHFEEERPAFQDSFGFLQQSSLSGNQHKETSGRLKGRRWK
ncbi:hypothetical protein F8388_007002, partial [Cannabis sativa]